MVRLKRGDEVPFPNREIYELVKRNRRECIPEIVLRAPKVSTIGIFDFYRLPHPVSANCEDLGSVYLCHHNV